MANTDRKPSGKGTFGQGRLQLSKQYVTPPRRALMLALGGLLFIAVIAVAAYDFFSDQPGLLSNGPLSSNHASLESDCAACHAQPGTTNDEACSTCHEKFGDQVGVFSFASHYLYRSNDFQRVVPSEHETPCFSCHEEHGGRTVSITQVPDTQCLSCHAFGSFNRDHPPFDLAATRPVADGGLKFPHSHHVNELMKRQGWLDVEKACLSCHQPDPEGKAFQPLDFEDHCGACHLPATLRTDPLPVRSARTEQRFGVETLDQIQQRGGTGSRWSSFLSANEFRQAGGRVIKTPLYHRDPWILHNLRTLRRLLFPQAGLADLLTGTADVSDAELLTLYTEALGTLRGYALELRSRPERAIQGELKTITTLIEELEQRLQDPYAPLDESKFMLGLGPPAEGLSDRDRAEIETLVARLTKACQQCHQVENATIVRVKESLSTLRRAEFNHRSHILQVRCLDCHREIPILENLGSAEPLDPEADNASIRNLPKIEECQTCHNRGDVANTCVTCHQFHANKQQRSNLLLYLQSAPESEGTL